MDYNILLDLATDLGYELAMCGAETFRVEESVSRVLSSYGIASEVFAIPNYLIVTVMMEDGTPITRMRRIGSHGNDLDAVEKFSGLSRAYCSRRPEPKEAQRWLEVVRSQRRAYPVPIIYLGYFLGALGFGLLFGGNFLDGLCAGICGILVGLVIRFLDAQDTNQFFRTIAASFLMALLAYAFGAMGIAKNPDAITIGALMILVPGLLFTNAMRDIIYGDTNSGINRIVQVFLIAAALAVGTATGILSAWGVGGGTLLLLVMTLFLGVDQRTAQGINLLYFLPTAGVGLLFHRKAGMLDKQALRQAIPWGVATAALGAWCATAMDTELLRRPFGVYLLVMGVITLIKKPEP